MYSFTSNIRYSEVDSNKKLTWLSLMDYFQDCSAFHSEEKNVGIDYLRENEIAWVLLYWHIKCEKMPEHMQKVEIQTWPYDMKGFYGMRNFSMNDMEDNRLAYANSIWVMIDTKTGHPAKVPEGIFSAYEYGEAIDMASTSRKLVVPKEYEEGESFVVPSYFIDTNKHMNNSKYVAVAMNYVPDTFIINEVKVEYKKSATLGDIVVPRITASEEKITVVLAAEDGKPYAVVEFIN